MTNSTAKGDNALGSNYGRSGRTAIAAISTSCSGECEVDYPQDGARWPVIPKVFCVRTFDRLEVPGQVLDVYRGLHHVGPLRPAIIEDAVKIAERRAYLKIEIPIADKVGLHVM